MPKDEFDFDDPMELNGVGMVCAEDTTALMTECFVEEFMRLGYHHRQILALFRNPHYIGMNRALQNRGEAFVRDMISEVFARWGRLVVWNSGFCPSGPPEGGTPNEGQAECEVNEQAHTRFDPEPSFEPEATATDPLGAPIPDVRS